MKKPSMVNCLYCFHDLVSQTKRSFMAEYSMRLITPQLCQIIALQRHHYVVKIIISTTTKEFTYVIASWNKNKNKKQLNIVNTVSCTAIYVFCLSYKVGMLLILLLLYISHCLWNTNKFYEFNDTVWIQYWVFPLVLKSVVDTKLHLQY